MLHLVGMTHKGTQWSHLLDTLGAADMVVTYPETAALHEELARLHGTDRCYQLGVDMDEAALAQQVSRQQTITWFDDD